MWSMSEDLAASGASEGERPGERTPAKYNPWTKEEDERLKQLVEEHGAKNWGKIAEELPGRTGKSCRLRWVNQLREDIKTGPFTPEEDETILQAHAQHGNKWTTIAQLLPGRTDNAVKNRWNSTLRKRLEDQQRQEQQLRFAAALAVVASSGLLSSGTGAGPSVPVAPPSPGLHFPPQEHPQVTACSPLPRSATPPQELAIPSVSSLQQVLQLQLLQELQSAQPLTDTLQKLQLLQALQQTLHRSATPTTAPQDIGPLVGPGPSSFPPSPLTPRPPPVTQTAPADLLSIEGPLSLEQILHQSLQHNLHQYVATGTVPHQLQLLPQGGTPTTMATLGSWGPPAPLVLGGTGPPSTAPLLLSLPSLSNLQSLTTEALHLAAMDFAPEMSDAYSTASTLPPLSAFVSPLMAGLSARGEEPKTRLGELQQVKRPRVGDSTWLEAGPSSAPWPHLELPPMDMMALGSLGLCSPGNITEAMIPQLLYPTMGTSWPLHLGGTGGPFTRHRDLPDLLVSSGLPGGTAVSSPPLGSPHLVHSPDFDLEGPGLPLGPSFETLSACPNTMRSFLFPSEFDLQRLEAEGATGEGGKGSEGEQEQSGKAL